MNMGFGIVAAIFFHSAFGLAQQPDPAAPCDEMPKVRIRQVGGPGISGIIGRDDRIPFKGQDFSRAIGRIEDPNGHCTATLVGPNLILTAKHCISYRHLIGQKKVWQFTPAFNTSANPENRKFACVADFVMSPSSEVTDPQADWALGILDRPIGEEFGWLKIASPDPEIDLAHGHLFTAGYPHGKSEGGVQGYMQIGCSLKALSKSQTIFFDCDTDGGQSGSAIVSLRNGKPFVVGNLSFTRWVTEKDLTQISAGSLPEVGAVVNGGVSASAFWETWQKLLAPMPGRP